MVEASYSVLLKSILPITQFLDTVFVVSFYTTWISNNILSQKTLFFLKNQLYFRFLEEPEENYEAE